MSGRSARASVPHMSVKWLAAVVYGVSQIKAVKAREIRDRSVCAAVGTAHHQDACGRFGL